MKITTPTTNKDRSAILTAPDRCTTFRASSPTAELAIGLVAPAVMTAIIASTLLLDHGQVTLPGPAALLSVGGAIVGVRRTGNISAALAVGFPLYWFVGVIDAVVLEFI